MKVKTVMESWNRFWFKPIDPINLDLLRMLTGLVLCFFYFIRFLDFELLYTETGIVPLEYVEVVARGYISSIWLSVIQLEGVLYYLHLLFIILLLLFAFGVGGRLLSPLVFIIHVIFLQRNLAVNYGADFVASFLLLYLCFRKPRYFLIMDSKSWKIQRSKQVVQSWVDSVGFRMLQIQVCIIYAYGGLEKLKGSSWWEGTAVWKTFSNNYLMDVDLSFIAGVPIILVLANFFVLFWEIFFPVLIWVNSLRVPMLIFGVLFHFSIGVINITFFSSVMIISYLVFLSPLEIRRGILSLYGRVSN